MLIKFVGVIFTTSVDYVTLAELEKQVKSAGCAIADIVYLHNNVSWEDSRTYDYPSVNHILHFVVIAQKHEVANVQVNTYDKNVNTNYQKMVTRPADKMWKVCLIV